MSDVTVAPNAAPPPTNEAVIEQNPTSSPQPIGSQAPQKPTGNVEGSPHRPQSRREAIQAAFDKANTAERREQTKPKQARIGDNHPPEETPKEAPKPLDLRKRPTAQQQPRDRGEHGHFAPRQDNETQAQAAQRQNAAAQAQQRGQQQRYVQLPEGTPFRDPPQRMTHAAKADWHKVPESVRGDVHRGLQEFGNAYRQYRADHELVNTIRPYAQMAQQHGTTLQRALSNYVNMEHKLRNDVIGGLDVIVNNLNLRTPDGRRLGLRDVAYHILNQSPEQHQLVQAQNAQTAQRYQIGQLHQIVNDLAQSHRQMQYERQFSYTRSALDRYADDGRHPRFDELGDLIEQEIKAGYDLETAYRRAELLRPATRAAQTRNGTDRSIHGAPDAGPSNGTSRRGNGKDKPVGRREAIANAIKRVNGSL